MSGIELFIYALPIAVAVSSDIISAEILSKINQPRRNAFGAEVHRFALEESIEKSRRRSQLSPGGSIAHPCEEPMEPSLEVTQEDGILLWIVHPVALLVDFYDGRVESWEYTI